MAKPKKNVPASQAVIDAKPVAVTTIQTEDPTAALSIVQPRITALAARSVILKITDAASSQEANNALIEVTSMHKAVKEKLETITKPMNQALKAARDFFNPALAQLDTLALQLRQGIVAYNRAAALVAENQRKEAADKAEAAAAKGDMKAALAHATDAVSVVAPARAVMASSAVATAASNIKHAQVTTRKRWTFKVVNLKKVPREYLELNEKVVRATISSGIREIDGLEIFQEDGLAVGGR